MINNNLNKNVGKQNVFLSFISHKKFNKKCCI